MKVLAMVVALGGAGCSVLWGKGPPTKPQADIECTESYNLPIADAVFAAGGIALATSGFVAQAAEKSPDADVISGPIIALGLLIGLPTVISSIVGFSNVKACRAAIRVQEATEAKDQVQKGAPVPPKTE